VRGGLEYLREGYMRVYAMRKEIYVCDEEVGCMGDGGEHM